LPIVHTVISYAQEGKKRPYYPSLVHGNMALESHLKEELSLALNITWDLIYLSIFFTCL